jgi:hypothetical protein
MSFAGSAGLCPRDPNPQEDVLSTNTVTRISKVGVVCVPCSDQDRAVRSQKIGGTGPPMRLTSSSTSTTATR